MSSPLAYTQSVAKALEGVAVVPQPVSAQVGEIIIPCAGTYVTLLGQTGIDLGAGCGSIPVGDLVITAAFDCANVSNDDGTTNWAAQDAVSALLDAAGEFLWDWTMDQRADAVYKGTQPVISYLQTGGLAMATISAQLAVP